MATGTSSRKNSLSRMFGTKTPTGDADEGNGNVNVDVDLEVESNVGDVDDLLLPTERMHLEFAKADPMGRFLLAILADTNALAKKCGLKEGRVDHKDFCSTFYTSKKMEQMQLNSKLQEAEDNIKHKMVQGKLNAHHSATSYPPPAHFSQTPTLLTAAHLGQAQKLFPSGGQKFYGYKGGRDENGGGMTVIEYLSALNRGQEIANLSRKEFLNIMLGSTTGRAHTLLLDWIANGESVEEIFFGLMTNFDGRNTAEESKQRLSTYKAFKTSNLAKVIADIMNLAGRASTIYPVGPSRQAFYNIEGVNILIKCLPTASSHTANNTFHSLTADLGRAATLTELSKALAVFRHTIDLDIKQNGYDNGQKNAKGFVAFSKQKGKKPTGAKNKATGYALTAAVNAGGQQSGKKDNNGNSTDRTKGNQGSYKHGDHKSGHQTAPKGSNYKGKNYNPNHSYSTPRNGEYCSLCGNVDHKAIDGCPFIQSDRGVVIKYNPTQGVCGDCPPSIMPRLNHGPRVCPYRVDGPLYGTADK